MTRCEKIAYAVNLIEKLFCKLYYITGINRELDFEDLYTLRRSLLQRVMGSYKFDLIDLSDDGLDQFIEHCHKEIAAAK